MGKAIPGCVHVLDLWGGWRKEVNSAESRTYFLSRFMGQALMYKLVIPVPTTKKSCSCRWDEMKLHGPQGLLGYSFSEGRQQDIVTYNGAASSAEPTELSEEMNIMRRPRGGSQPAECSPPPHPFQAMHSKKSRKRTSANAGKEILLNSMGPCMHVKLFIPAFISLQD